jgi:hypothetical protein
MQVRFNPQNTVVMIVISVEGTVFWDYNLDIDGFSFKEQGLTKSSVDHTVGLPSEINLDNHYWTIRVINGTDGDVDVNVKVTYYQDDVQLIDQSVEQLTLSADSSETINGNAILSPV